MILRAISWFFAILGLLSFTKTCLAADLFLSWEPSASANVAGYRIYYDNISHANGVCPADYANFLAPIDAGSSTSYRIDDLVPGSSYFFQITAYDADGNESICSVNPGEQSISIALPTVSGNQGGGGGGGSSGPTPELPVPEPELQSSQAEPAEKVADNPSLPETDSRTETVTSASFMEVEAEQVLANEEFVPLPLSEVSLYESLEASAGLESDEARRRLAHFIHSGTVSTKILGAGERAGVLASYASSFKRLPTTKTEWEDVIKIANGRWTGERNEEVEESAKKLFKKVYRRLPDYSVSHDENAIMVIAYGLRPSNRKIENERSALKSYRAVFSKMPEAATDWDLLRAIAYSGAKRKQ